jgi:hypothetical protein
MFANCNGSSKKSDQQRMEESVRNYFFMGDSVQVTVTVTDTVYAKDLDFMLENTEENIRLVQLDIDTLQLMIDDWNYKALDFEKTGNTLEALSAKNKALGYQLKHKELEYTRASFEQTNRIFLHLKRSTWADISGFEAMVSYQLGEEKNELIVLMDADFNVVD